MDCIQLGSNDPNVVEWAFSGDYDPDQPVLIDALCPSRYLTKRSAIRVVTCLASAFESDSTVCLHLPNDVFAFHDSDVQASVDSSMQILYPVLVLSILAAGCRWTGTNISCTSSELAHHIRVSETNYIITTEEHVENVESAIRSLDAAVDIIIYSDLVQAGGPLTVNTCGYRGLHDLIDWNENVPLEDRLSKVPPGSVATLMSTSGTTGPAKMAERSHRAIVVESKADEAYDQEKQYTIRRLFCTPMFHAYSFPKMVINPLRQGCEVYYLPRFSSSFAQKVFEFGITDIITVPPILSRLIEQAQSGIEREYLQTLRCVLCAGAPLTKALKAEFSNLFDLMPRVAQEWGMTECGCIARVPYGSDEPSISVGRAVGNYRLRISHDNRMKLSNGRVVGELLVEGPQMMIGYRGNESSTSDAFSSDGWYKTGDLGYIDSDGRIYLVDRVKDIIKVNGWQVSPTELENVLLQLPAVEDCAIFKAGRSVDEHPQIFVVSSEADVGETDLKEYMMTKLSRYKVASCDITFVERIPRAPSGKILRRVLRAQFDHEKRLEVSKVARVAA